MGICLNMIVKNEAPRIARCLESVRPLIDGWVICDTGSTDGTPALVAKLLADLPGALYEEPWQDFETNRNEALAHAKAFAGPDDYILFMDADDVLVSADPQPVFTRGSGADCYEIEEHDQNLRFWRPCIVRASLPWRWVGKTHECLCCDAARRTERLQGIYRQRGTKTPEQCRAKLERDLAILTEAVLISPQDGRSRFYLAQTYKDLGRREEALHDYEARMQMPGWEEETWWAQYEAAILRELLHHPVEAVLMSYLSCYERRPTRAEPLVQAARFCRVGGMHHAALLFSQQAIQIKQPDDRLFVDENVYQWRALDEFSINAYWSGLHQLSAETCRTLLKGIAPESERGRITQNLKFAEDRLRDRLLVMERAGAPTSPKSGLPEAPKGVATGVVPATGI
jgi:glycosyltransferase involved in cell wall biosynthesis